MDPNIREATRADVWPIAGLTATAMQDLDAAQWLVPDKTTRLPALTDSLAIVIEHALNIGQIWVTGDLLGASVWLPGGAHTPPPPDHDNRLTLATGPWIDRFQILNTLLADHHPIALHMHLAALAVHPDHQHRGLGSALLTHSHREWDQTATPAYLYAPNRRSQTLFLRHGYRPRNHFYLPDATPIHPMWRAPSRLPHP